MYGNFLNVSSNFDQNHWDLLYKSYAYYKRMSPLCALNFEDIGSRLFRVFRASVRHSFKSILYLKNRACYFLKLHIWSHLEQKLNHQFVFLIRVVSLFFFELLALGKKIIRNFVSKISQKVF